MSMFWRTAITISPAIGAHARLTWVQRPNTAWAGAPAADFPGRRAALGVAAQLHGAVGAHRDERDRRPEVRAGHPEARRGEGRTGDQAHALLADEAEADALVVPDALQGAAKDRQLEPHAAGGDPDRGGPLVVLDTDRGGDRLPQQHRDDRQDGGEHQPGPCPALERGDQPCSDPEVPQHALACGGHLHRLAGDGQDQEVADQGRERAVIGRAAGRTRRSSPARSRCWRSSPARAPPPWRCRSRAGSRAVARSAVSARRSSRGRAAVGSGHRL